MSDDLLARRVRPNPNVVSNRLGDAGVLVHLKTNRIFELNSTGVRIWELIGEGLDLRGIEEKLLEEFNATPERLRNELTALIGALEREGLVQ